MMNQLLIATENEHKKIEFGRILEGFPLTSLKEHPLSVPIIEDADTFEGNAAIKANLAFKETGILSLGDDSGLEVDALNGEPGIYSARYVPGSDLDRVYFLLHKMQGITQRSARFRCALVLTGAPNPQTLGVESLLHENLYWQDGLYIAQGKIEGVIGTELQGSQGFGYDPIFYIDPSVYFKNEVHANALKSIAELTPQQKDLISHRAMALKEMFKILKKIFDITK